MAREHEHPMLDLIQALRQVTVTSHKLEIERTLHDALDYVDHNEWGLGLEVLCDNLYEYEFPLPKAIFDQILTLGNRWGIDQSRIEMLRQLIVDGGSSPAA